MSKKEIVRLLDIFIEKGIYILIFLSAVSIGGSNIIAFLLFVSFLMRVIIKRNDIHFCIDSIDKEVLLFVLIIFISGIFAYDYMRTISKFFGTVLLYLLIYYVIINYIKEYKQINNILIGYWISNIICSSYGIYQHFILNIDRASSFTHNPNRLGSVMMMFIIFNFSLFIFGRNKFDRIYGIIGLIFGYLGLVSTLSRGPLIGTIIGIFAISIIKSKKFLYGFIILCLLIILILPQNYVDRLYDLTDLKSNNVYQRIQMYKAGLKVFKDNYLLGIGLYNVKLIYDKYDFTEINYNHMHLHNIFLNIAVETGIFGFLVFSLMTINVFKRAWNNVKKNIHKQYTVGFFGIVLAMFFQNNVDVNLHTIEVGIIFITFISLIIQIDRCNLSH